MNLYSNQKKNKLDNHHSAYILMYKFIKYLDQRKPNNNFFIFILETLELVYFSLKKHGPHLYYTFTLSENMTSDILKSSYYFNK